MVEANLKGLGTKNCINCVDIESIIDECVLEQQENQGKILKKKDNYEHQLSTKSKSFKKFLDRSKYNNKYMNELKSIKFIKSQVNYRNFAIY
jgi:hypothetical protein